MKRRASSASQPYVYAQQDGNFVFETRTLARPARFVLKRAMLQEGVSRHLDDTNGGAAADSVDYIVCFRPEPLPMIHASRVHVSVRYTGTTRSMRNRTVFASWVLPPHTAAGCSELVLLKGELEYKCFPTHQLHLSSDGMHVACLHVRLLNTTVSVGGLYDLMVEPHAPPYIGERFHCLDWFPPDVEPAYWGLRVNPRMIPQRTPLWFRFRSGISGTKAYKLIGYYLGPEPKPGAYYSIDDEGTFTELQRTRMRLGSLSEHATALLYLCAYPKRELHEVGWCSAAPHGYPSDWGASPDASVFDPESPHDQWGACEFKTSTKKNDMEPYFIPQLYMEMIALNVQWADLLRYVPDGTTHVYRLNRDASTEQMLLRLWRRSITNQHTLHTIVQEPEYVAARKHFQALASQMSLNPTCVIGPNQFSSELREQERKRKSIITPVPFTCSSEENESAADEKELEELAQNTIHALKRHATSREISQIIHAQFQVALRLP